MAEITQRDGSWSYDDGRIRIVPGAKAHPVRQVLGEVVVPLAAVAGVTFERDRKGGRLRLRLRDGACPVVRAADGRLPEGADPYRLVVEAGREDLAEYFVAEVRQALLLEQLPEGPVDRFLLPGPALPVSGGGGDGTAAFDGREVRLTWNWKGKEAKTSGGPTTLPLAGLTGVSWVPAQGLENGYLRFLTRSGGGKAVAAEHDPHALDLWGLSKKEHTAVLVAAAVLVALEARGAPQEEPARLAKGEAPEELPAAPAAPAAPADDPDALLRRLRELGELHRDGVLTDEEFSLAKQAVLRRL
ncbi:DUF4429 domain-containing protein [Streptomyces sp. NPDC058374]|uniref:DUF4429 domain-containing protein n=1 Tax=unclassified Streptomyces TaxID=2593676 RepID=UPI00365F6DC0